MIRKLLLACLAIWLLSTALHAQSLPVGTVLEDYYRRQQLLGKGDSLTSFTLRPIFPAANSGSIKNVYYPIGSAEYNKIDAATSWNDKSGFSGVLLPLSLQTQFNSDHPVGFNDGAMIPAKGLQTLFSGGVYAKYGILTVQFRPEVVIAANNSFQTLDKRHYDIIFSRYYDIYNNIDLPARFGTGTYSKAYWGQSSVRLNYKSMSFGISTENLWWGPGVRNSLIMSNSAPGFKHITLNTSKPIVTPVGSFEGQFIAGRLENSGYGPLEPDSTHKYLGNPLYVPKPTDWRYISGFVLTWQPKWVTGLFLGMTSSAQSYSKDLGSFGNYFPFFSPYKKVTADQPINQRDTRSSVFARWVWPEEHAEVYFEYGRNNNTNTFTNSLLKPEDSRAYVFGLRKIVPFNTSRHESILISIEATQLQETSQAKVLNGDSWYVNSYIRQGYTNQGQLLGAGIGPGANMQSLDISWISGLKRLGIQIERYVHNNDFYYYTYTDSNDYRRHWTDLSLGFSGEWDYKNFIFNAKLLNTYSLNYQWYLDPTLERTTGNYFTNGATAFNLQLQAGITYRF